MWLFFLEGFIHFVKIINTTFKGRLPYTKTHMCLRMSVKRNRNKNCRTKVELLCFGINARFALRNTTKTPCKVIFTNYPVAPQNVSPGGLIMSVNKID